MTPELRADIERIANRAINSHTPGGVFFISLDEWQRIRAALEQHGTAISNSVVALNALAAQSTGLVDENARLVKERDEWKRKAEAMKEAAESAVALIGVMFGDVDGRVPERVYAPLGVYIKVGAIYRDLLAAIAAMAKDGAA